MSKREALKDHFKERQIFLNRTISVLLMVSIAFIILFSRLIYFQVIQHNKFSYLAKNNQVRISPIPSIRGNIVDRNQKTLAENIPSHSLELNRSKSKDINETISMLSKVITIDESDIKSFKKQAKYKSRFENITIRQNLTEEEIAKFANVKYEFPEAEVAATLNRHYPYGQFASHVVGYIGQINDSDLKRYKPGTFRGTNHIGKTGLELFLEDRLRGEIGYEHIETDARGRSLRVLQKSPPVNGENIKLSIDIELQRHILEAMGDRVGAVVAIEPGSGEILALVSAPSYDPNVFISDSIDSDLNRTLNNPKKPLFNRAVSGQYPPGSIIKPILSLWALENKTITPNTMIFDPGYYKIAEESKVFRDWKRDGHGWVNVKKAIIESCTTFFYHLSQLMGVDEIHKCFSAFGLGKKHEIGLANIAEGIAPSKEWKAENIHQPWFPGETLNTGIGQGYTLISPLQSAYMASIIATRGNQIEMSLFRGNENTEKIRQLAIFPESKNWDIVIDAMERVVTDRKGTAHKISKAAKYPIAGKTGTAQVHTLTKRIAYDKIPKHLRDHSWFIAFAPVESPQIAISVILEHDKYSAKLATSIINFYLDKQAQA